MHREGVATSEGFAADLAFVRDGRAGRMVDVHVAFEGELTAEDLSAHARKLLRFVIVRHIRRVKRKTVSRRQSLLVVEGRDG